MYGSQVGISFEKRKCVSPHYTILVVGTIKAQLFEKIWLLGIFEFLKNHILNVCIIEQKRKLA